MKLILKLRHNVRRQSSVFSLMTVKGFSLIELIMTIVVVSIVAIPLSLLISQHVESAIQSEDYAMAVNLARFEMEKVNNMNYTSIVDASFSNYQGYNYDVTRTVTYAQGNGSSTESLKQIEVTVRKSATGSDMVRLVTYIAKNVNYGI
jgi:prepilin-type N-terminal cleavage/methylation domain-containing protein